MPLPGYQTSVSYLRDLDSRSPMGEAQSFRITPIRTGANNNPELDYAKLIIMLGGALGAALLYDLFMDYQQEEK